MDERFVGDPEFLHLSAALTDTHVLIVRPTPDGLRGFAVSAARYHTGAGDSLVVRSSLDRAGFARTLPEWASERHSFRTVRPDTVWLAAPFLAGADATWGASPPSGSPHAVPGLPYQPL